ncbi:hypothetical protein Kpol_2001p62 [Vanderwaltozyma polyspora DSM 70294]|uniref:SURP motif domain-containing protein n=1 Tax=Vanderwaltozyma polyspora (strain ATCC 22028 / DSM 70294 / BCRC 21397 / CBS 2163 / NBRC 10782 / NRRL Y-8283 / UCD 57-17) TaxID=436907 RepID=A7TGU3_VANPO|nr:uncharacterized protein Kpol_2001p62 [Vanderwaltozyma polyspora DSM 70294]EDO18556.1 hypothetical protein Kpol_2001p62 [Vanderwaltozyma polyspora DSM 70294]
MTTNYAIPDGEDSYLIESIEKTVLYVRKNGVSFEDKLAGDDKFSFVRPEHKYYKFYKAKLNEDFKDKSNDEEEEVVVNVLGDELPTIPYEYVFSGYDKNIDAKSLDILKLTAQFVVLNKDIDALGELRKFYAADEKFEFIKEDHPLHTIFINFIDQYKLIMDKEGLDSSDVLKYSTKRDIIERCFKRAEFYEYSKEIESKKDEIKKLQDIQFAAFDWTNFKTLATIDFNIENDTFVKPIDLNSLKIKQLTNKNKVITSIFTDVEIINIEKNEESTKRSEGKKSKRKMKIKAAGETRLKKQKQTQGQAQNKKMIECPITKKMIPEDSFEQHMQTLLGDPRYREQKLKYDAERKITNLTSHDVYRNVKNVSKKGND